MNYLTSLDLSCPSFNKNLQEQQWAWPCAGPWDTMESQDAESLSQEVAIGCVRMTLLPHTKVKEDVSIK